MCIRDRPQSVVCDGGAPAEPGDPQAIRTPLSGACNQIHVGGRFPVSRAIYPVALVLLLALGGCASAPLETSSVPVATRPAAAPLGVPLLKDGTPAFRADILSIPDAVPRPEPVTAAGNKSPYTVLGSTYRISAVAPGHRERGYGSWYGTKFHGQNTANGEPYDVYSMTAAHKTMPLPSYALARHLVRWQAYILQPMLSL